MTARRGWWVTGAVVAAGVMFGLGVIVGALVFDDDGSSESVGADDVREPGERLEDLLDMLGDRLEDRFDGLDGDDDASAPRRFGPLEDLAERLRERLDITPPEERRFDLQLPEDLAELGECLVDGVEDLVGDDEPLSRERARELWERCTS